MRATFLLLEDIKEELTKAVAGMGFRAPGGKPNRPPRVVIGHIPPKQSRPTGAEQADGADSEPPFILVRLLDGEIKDESGEFIHEVKVGVLCGVYSEESYSDIQAGYHDIANLTDTALLALHGKRYWADNYWILRPSLRWTSGLDKTVDVYQAGSQFSPIYGAAIIGTFYASAPPLPPVSGTDAPNRVDFEFKEDIFDGRN